MAFNIETDVPTPASQRWGGINQKYPWEDMNAGDSFEVPLNGKTGTQLQRNLHNAAYGWALRHHLLDAKFSTRQTEDGVRIWRTA